MNTVGDLCRYYDQAKNKNLAEYDELLEYAALLKARLDSFNKLEMGEEIYIRCLAQELDCLISSMNINHHEEH